MIWPLLPLAILALVISAELIKNAYVSRRD